MKRSIPLSAFFLLLSGPIVAKNRSLPPDASNTGKAVVHVYRPSHLVGFGWIFNLKANNEKVAQIKNGRSIVLELEPGQTQFRIKKKEVNLNLEAGKNYYLRTSLVRNLWFGKQDLVGVTENFALTELD